MPISISRGISLNSSGSYSVLKEIIFSEKSTFNNAVIFNSSGTFNGDVRITSKLVIPSSSGSNPENGSIWFT
jgi:hypothetical protein